MVVVPRGRLQAHFRELARPSPRTPLPALGSQRNLPSPSPADASGISRPQNGVEEKGPICRRRPPQFGGSNWAVTAPILCASPIEAGWTRLGDGGLPKFLAGGDAAN